MSDTSGLPNTDAEGVPAEERPERFEAGDDESGSKRDSEAESRSDSGQSSTPDSGQGSDSGSVSDSTETGVAPAGAEDVTTAENSGTEAAEPPPADFDPAQQPSNPDLVKNTEPPD